MFQWYTLSNVVTWKKMRDMNEKRSFISNSNVILNGRIWVCGVWNKDTAWKSVEMYDPETNEWKYVKEMNECRRIAAASVADGKIFCCGGSDGRKKLDSAECYDPSSDVWTLICPLPEAVRGHSAVRMNKNLVVVGGWIEGDCLNSVWMLDTLDENGEWIEKPKMSLPRGDFSIAKINNKIFVCGGHSGEKAIDSVEIFDGEVWRNGPKLATPRFRSASVVIPADFAKDLNGTCIMMHKTGKMEQSGLTWAASCPPQQNARFHCSEPAMFVIDVSSTMGTNENIQTLFDYLQTIILPQYNFKGYQPVQIMTYGANSTPIMETTDYEKQVCPGMNRLLDEALNNGLQEVPFKEVMKQLYHNFGDDYGDPVIIFSANNNKTDIDNAINYRHKHLGDEYFTVVALNGTFQDWRDFATISTYTVPINQIFDYINLDMCILDASCRDLESFCTVYPPSTTQRPSTTQKTVTPTKIQPTVLPSGPDLIHCQSEPCTCPNNTEQIGTDILGNPIGGCFLKSYTPANFALSKNKCNKLHGFLAMDENNDKHSWLRDFYFTLAPSTQYFWIGLAYDRSENQYIWPDNSILGSFQPWSSPAKLPPPVGQDCVLVTSSGEWIPADCRNSAGFICELPPCDQRGYCNVSSQ